MGKTSHSEQQEMFPPPPLLPFQGGKPQPSPLARRTDSASSHAAAEQVESSGKARIDRERAADWVWQHPGKTTRELSELQSEMDLHNLSRRLPDAVKAGLIRRQDNGTKPATWYPAEDA